MPPDDELPGRPEVHSRSTWSTRAFASILPREWLVHPLEEDYGIDRRVEVFENGHTTGVFFNVQLKSTDRGSGHQPAESIYRTTLNYWAQTPDATLVAIGHDSTETLWYQWAHLLGHDANPKTKSRLVRCVNVLDGESAAELAEEARAWRLARDLSRHFPIDVHVSGNKLYGESATPLKRAIGQKLATLPSFVRVVHGAPVLPYLAVSIEDSRVMAGMRGNYSQQITWGFNGPRDYGALASDVIASLALSCANVGAEDLGVRLLKLAAAETHTLMEANAFGYAMALLTKHGESDAVLTLIRRTAGQEGHPSRDIALAAVASASPTPELMKAVAYVVRDAARTWTRPATGLYNAANSLRGIDSAQAIALYEEAAQADPAYRTRAYWWRERGTAHWDQDDSVQAEECYRQAIALGDAQAQAYLGDIQMRTGRYADALATFENAPIWERPEDAQWRLSFSALRLIVEELGIQNQVRAHRAIPDFYPEPADESLEALEATALDAVRADALNGWAYTGLASAWTGQGDKHPLIAAVAAAVIINVAGYLWINLVIDTLTDRIEDEKTRMLIAQDAMWCAWRNFGDGFADEVLDYPLLDDEARDMLLDFFESVRLPKPPLEMRRHRDDGTVESFLIPTDPRGEARALP